MIAIRGHLSIALMLFTLARVNAQTKLDPANYPTLSPFPTRSRHRFERLRVNSHPHQHCSDNLAPLTSCVNTESVSDTDGPNDATSTTTSSSTPANSKQADKIAAVGMSYTRSLREDLQTLPQELWDEIYDLTFSGKSINTVRVDSTYRPPALLRVNRSTRSEFANHYYSTTDFHGDWEPCWIWIHSLTDEHRHMIQKMRCFISHDEMDVYIDRRKEWSEERS